MTPIQLFLSSLFTFFIFNNFSNKEVLKKIDNIIAEFFILLVFFSSIISLIGSIFWGIFYYIKI